MTPNPWRFERKDLVGVIGQQSHREGQSGAGCEPLARSRGRPPGKPSRRVRLECVDATFVLDLVGMQLRVRANPATLLLGQVDENTPTLFGADAFKARSLCGPAVATQGAEDITGGA